LYENIPSNVETKLVTCKTFSTGLVLFIISN